MVMHTLVQGLEDAAIAKDIMEEYATNDDLQDRLTLGKIKKRRKEYGWAPPNGPQTSWVTTTCAKA